MSANDETNQAPMSAQERGVLDALTFVIDNDLSHAQQELMAENRRDSIIALLLQGVEAGTLELAAAETTISTLLREHALAWSLDPEDPDKL